MTEMSGQMAPAGDVQTPRKGVIEALSEVNLNIVDELDQAFRQGVELIGQAERSMAAALADRKIEEHELLTIRNLVLRAMVALRPLSSSREKRNELIVRVIDAISATADCFLEYEVSRSGRLETGILVGEGPVKNYIAEFSREIFDGRLDELVRAMGDVRENDRFNGLESPTDSSGSRENSGHPLDATRGYLEIIDRYAIPGCVYGSQSRRQNPYLAARALRAGTERLRHLLQVQQEVQEPIDRLARLEGRLTLFIEEIRQAGEPIEEPGRWMKRLRTNPLDTFRQMCQDLLEIENAIRTRGLSSE